MTELRLYGKKPRCWWCGGVVSEPADKLSLEFGGERFQCIVCSRGCATAAVSGSRYVERCVPIFIIGIVISILLSFVPNFSVMMSGFFLLGLTILVCPFCTPQMTKMLGMKKSFLVGRILGLGTMILSLTIWMIRT